MSDFRRIAEHRLDEEPADELQRRTSVSLPQQWVLFNGALATKSLRVVNRRVTCRDFDTASKCDHRLAAWQGRRDMLVGLLLVRRQTGAEGGSVDDGR